MRDKGVLLVNLGSPDSPSVPAVRRYLREFLMDGRVLNMPWPVRFAVVNLIVIPTRARHAAAAYRSVWTPHGAPLIVISRSVQARLQSLLTVPVELAMRYGNPSIPAAVKRLRERGIRELLLIPLFPHYAMSSYGTAVARVKEVVSSSARDIRLKVQPPYYDQSAYIQALVASATPSMSDEGDHLLFSFHGLPERHIRKADPTRRHCLTAPHCCEVDSAALPTCYRAQCLRTVKAFAAHADLSSGKYSVAFQSRMGPGRWLEPATVSEIARLGHAGNKHLLVICPAFVSDCLETIEEIGLRGGEVFRATGGGTLTLIPCLNDHPRWIAALESMVHSALGTSGNSSPAGHL